DVHDNTFIAHADVYGGKVAKARAVWVGLPKFTPKGAKEPIADARGIFRNNYVAALGRKGAKAGALCVVCLNESPNLIFLNNTVLSTWGNVLLGDDYGHAGGYPKFVGNTFRRVGRQKDYHTIRHDYAGRPGTGVFLDNRYEGGAGEDRVRLREAGRIVMQAVLDIHVKDVKDKPIEGAEVVIRDRSGTAVFRGVSPGKKTEAMLVAEDGASLSVNRPAKAGARGYVASIVLEKGMLRAVLTRHILTPTGKELKTPYRITVGKKGYTEASRAVDTATWRRIEIVLVAQGR
ncbi:MAG TPA: hypothetical protein VM031_05740, partial [Phycisphaerae bacterium]|nr:hypothetical protein [Phycisphaerae bacterium]